MKNFNNEQNSKWVDDNKYINSRRPIPVSKGVLAIPLLISSMMLASCGGDNSVANAPEPIKPDEYQSDNTQDINGLVAYYDFEDGLSDAANISADAEAVGLTTDLPAAVSASFDGQDGIHALSKAVVFSGLGGISLPGDAISRASYSVSLWVKPNAADSGPIFFAQSEKGSITLDQSGLHVTGATGFGTNGDESVSYSYTLDSTEFKIPASTYSHLVFTVDEGKVNIYVNGLRVYEQGDLLDDSYTFADGHILETDAFADLFSGTYNTIALGVTDSEDNSPFVGKLDNLRIYNYAIYYGNITTLSREVVNEGPSIDVSSELVGSDVELAWTLDRISPESIMLMREAFEDGSAGAVDLTAESPLSGSDMSFSDMSVPIGKNYRYQVIARTSIDQIYNSEFSNYLRIPGTDPYSAVSATFNEETENVELSLYLENISLSTYDVLRGTDINLANAATIATGLTDPTYIDEKDSEEFALNDGTTYYYWVSATDSSTASVTTSLALPTASTTTGGEFVQPGTLILQENEDGFCGVDGLVEDNNPGFTGTGFANTENAEGTAIRWKANIITAGDYTLIARYANGAGDNRWGIMTANGTELVNPLDLPTTEAWTTYEEVRHAVTLAEGVTDFVLTAQTAGGLGNIDSLTLQAVDQAFEAPEGVACAE